MTATEVLRRLLDECGVEWEAPTSFDGTARYDTVAGGYWFHEFDGKITIHGLTPEQAIAATLGTGACHVESSIIDTYEYNRWEYELSCGHTIIWEDSEPPNYCPNCGAKVVEPTTNDVGAEVDE